MAPPPVPRPPIPAPRLPQGPPAKCKLLLKDRQALAVEVPLDRRPNMPQERGEGQGVRYADDARSRFFRRFAHGD